MIYWLYYVEIELNKDKDLNILKYDLWTVGGDQSLWIQFIIQIFKQNQRTPIK